MSLYEGASMRKLSVAAIAVLVASALVVPMASAGPATGSAPMPSRPSLAAYTPAAVPGEVIVKFRRPMSRIATRQTVTAMGASLVAGPVAGFSVVKAQAGKTTDELIASLESDPAVASAEPNLVRYLSATAPSDPMFSDQWGLDNQGQAHVISDAAGSRSGAIDADMDVLEAWDQQKGSETVVAILDSGVDVMHPDLAANIWVNEQEIPGNGLDDDLNGYVDDIHGWDFADNDASLLQSAGGYAGWEHGTHVAGIIGAQADNALGTAGVCPNCKLMVLKMFKPFDTDGDGIKDTMIGDLAAELKALDYAIRMGADVINGSFGGSVVSSRAERATIKRAVAAGITMVFAAGNENGDNDLLIPGLNFDGDGVPDMTSPAYPASYSLPGIISVAASNDSDQNGFQSACFMLLGSAEWPCSFTNWGHDSVDVSAPGVDIISTLPDNRYATFDGTSMAAPSVAGVAALVKAEHPEYTAPQVVNAIMNSVDQPSSLLELLPIPDFGTLTGRFTTTSGRVNAAAALQATTEDRYPTGDGVIAGARTLSGTARSAVAWPEDVNDVFKKKLVKGVRYRAILDTSGAHDLDLQIYKPGTKEIWPFDGRCFGAGGSCPVLFYEPTPEGDVSKRFTARRGGTYYFHVNAWLLEQGGYTLKVVRI